MLAQVRLFVLFASAAVLVGAEHLSATSFSDLTHRHAVDEMAQRYPPLRGQHPRQRIDPNHRSADNLFISKFTSSGFEPVSLSDKRNGTQVSRRNHFRSGYHHEQLPSGSSVRRHRIRRPARRGHPPTKHSRPYRSGGKKTLKPKYAGKVIHYNVSKRYKKNTHHRGPPTKKYSFKKYVPRFSDRNYDHPLRWKPMDAPLLSSSEEREPQATSTTEAATDYRSTDAHPVERRDRDRSHESPSSTESHRGHLEESAPKYYGDRIYYEARGPPRTLLDP